MINKNQHIDTNNILKHLLSKGYAIQLSHYGDISHNEIKSMFIQYNGGYYNYANVTYIRIDEYIIDVRLIEIYPHHITFLLGGRND